MLKIKDLTASVNNRDILKGLNISIKPGELHAIMGPNGSGKSTLANVLSGKDGYKISGELKYEGKNLKEMSVDERAQKGIFLAFQYPTEIPGVNTNSFLKTSLNKVRKARGEKEIDTISFLKLLKEKSSELGIDEKMMSRQLNLGFSGGEKKKNEIFHMLMMKPKFCILDEIDSGLDIDALKIIAKGISEYSNKDNSLLIITHYQRLLDYVKPDEVHIFNEGKIVKSGDYSLVEKLEEKGYQEFV